MKKYWLIGILVILMLACNALTSPVMTPTPDIVFPTPPIADTSTPVIMRPTMTATVEALPSATLETEYQPFSPVIARMAPGPFVLVGGTENGEWLDPETVVPHLLDETYQIYGIDGPTGSAKGKKPVRDQICQTFWVETDSYPLSGRAVGVIGNWNVTPRLAQEFPTDTLVYVEALRDWLIDKGFPEPVVEISQILRVDLEGDGTDEVLISASHFVEPTGHDVEFGDYSLVLIRKVVGNSVETIPVVADYYYQNVELQFPLTYNGLLVADLNNDEVMEVVVGVERWEGSGVMVFETDGTDVRPVFDVLCGL